MSNAHSEELLQFSLDALSDAIQSKKVSPVEVTQLLLERIEWLNPVLKAFITVLYDQALQSAEVAEFEIMQGKIRGPLHGVPVGLKDLIYTKGIRTTMGAEEYKNYIPDYSATVAAKLEAAGAVLLGKLNTHQFAYGPTGDKSLTGPAKNPYNLSKITGGSSSGSGAAIAAALCYGALGTDTGGSIRVPSSFCGIVGMKPTFGRVSKYGVFPLSWTLDHVGPMTRTVKDNALLLGVLSGYDENDPYSLKTDAEDFTRLIGKSIKGRVIGVPSTFYLDNVNGDIRERIEEACDLFGKLGADVRRVEIPGIDKAPHAVRTIMKSEAYTVHMETLRNHPDLFDPEVKDRLLTGVDTKAYEYISAQQTKHIVVQQFRNVLKEVDILVTPTVPILPTDIGQREISVDGTTRLVPPEVTRLTNPTNLTGFPSLSVPCGFSRSGLPIGMQLIGKPLAEAELYCFAYAFEQEAGISSVKFDIA